MAKTIRAKYSAGPNASDHCASMGANRIIPPIAIIEPTKELTAEIEALMSEKNAGYNEYQERKREADELLTVKRNIDQVLHGAPSQRRDEHDR